VLRAACTDASGTFVLTAGIAVTRSAAAAQRAVTSRTAHRIARDQPRRAGSPGAGRSAILAS
jgi:hypothetical protein